MERLVVFKSGIGLFKNKQNLLKLSNGMLFNHSKSLKIINHRFTSDLR